MATQEALVNITCLAGADLSASSNMYRFVEGNQDSVTLCNADTDIALGVLQSLGTQGFGVAVAIEGVSKVKASAANSGVIAAGALVATDTDGRAKAAASGDRYRGVALKASAAEGDLFEIMLVKGYNLIA